MVIVSSKQEQQVTPEAAAEVCTMFSRIYREGRGGPADIRRLSKRGWKVVSVQHYPMPLPIDRLRADSPGSLSQFPTQEMVVFYRRCQVPHENRLKKRFRRPRH